MPLYTKIASDISTQEISTALGQVATMADKNNFNLYQDGYPTMEYLISLAGASYVVAAGAAWIFQSNKAVNIKRVLAPSLLQAFMICMWLPVLEFLRTNPFNHWFDGVASYTTFPFMCFAGLYFTASIYATMTRVGGITGMFYPIEEKNQAYGPIMHVDETSVPFLFGLGMFAAYIFVVGATAIDLGVSRMLFMILAIIMLALLFAAIVTTWIYWARVVKPGQGHIIQLANGDKYAALNIGTSSLQGYKLHFTMARAFHTWMGAGAIAMVAWGSYGTGITLYDQSFLVQLFLVIYVLSGVVFDLIAFDIITPNSWTYAPPAPEAVASIKAELATQLEAKVEAPATAATAMAFPNFAQFFASGGNVKQHQN